MKHIFFINPTAGKGNVQKSIVCAIKNYFMNKKLNYEIYITKCIGDAEAKAKEIAQIGERVCFYACGGEGTFYEILNGAIGFDNVTYGVVPCGSANDFLKFFGSKESFFDIEALVEGNPVVMDIIKAGDRYCLNGCSVGMDAMVARDMKLFKNIPFVSGSLAYKLAIVKLFFCKAGVKIKLSIDDKLPEIKNCLFAVIANGPIYGGGFMAAPKAVPNDGILDFTLVNTINKLKVPAFLKKYEKGQHANLDFCTVSRCKKMSFSSDIPIPVNLDGEIVVTKSMEFKIIKNAINFVIPKGIKLNSLIKV